MPPRRGRGGATQGRGNDEEVERLAQQVERLTQQVEALVQQQHDEDEFDDEINPFSEEGERGERRLVQNVDTRRWETGMRIDIPEFHGSLQPEEFVDWLNYVEEVLEFKEVPEDRIVSLVATRFRGRASAWWRQLKATRSRQGKNKITVWEKMKKHMRSSFLPPNYSRLIYQQLQNLK